MNTNAAASANNPTKFLNTISWVFICLGGYVAITGLFQLIAFIGMSYFGMNEMVNEILLKGDNVPALTRFMIENSHFWAALSMVIGAFTIVIATGLLHRKGWARGAFIALLSLGIAYSIFFAISSGTMAVSGFSSMGAAIDPENPVDKTMAPFMRTVELGGYWFGVLLYLGLCGWFGWLIKRFGKEDMLREFGSRA